MIPFLGYHHVLMILIAIAIILLCKCAHSSEELTQLTRRSITTGRMLLHLPVNTGHLPHLHVV